MNQLDVLRLLTSETWVLGTGDDLTDEHLEQHIERCGVFIESTMALHHASGQQSYRDQADAWRVLMEQAISQRSPARVAAMEAERGLT